MIKSAAKKHDARRTPRRVRAYLYLVTEYSKLVRVITDVRITA
jgi:hypothetical protein